MDKKVINYIEYVRLTIIHLKITWEINNPINLTNLKIYTEFKEVLGMIDVTTTIEDEKGNLLIGIGELNFCKLEGLNSIKNSLRKGIRHSEFRDEWRLI